jgi:hypothetical protein
MSRSDSWIPLHADRLHETLDLVGIGRPRCVTRGLTGGRRSTTAGGSGTSSDGGPAVSDGLEKVNEVRGTAVISWVSSAVTSTSSCCGCGRTECDGPQLTPASLYDADSGPVDGEDG